MEEETKYIFKSSLKDIHNNHYLQKIANKQTKANKILAKSHGKTFDENYDLCAWAANCNSTLLKISKYYFILWNREQGYDMAKSPRRI